MKKKYFIPFLLFSFVIISCNSKNEKKEASEDVELAEDTEVDSEKTWNKDALEAKKWLIKSIESYFENSENLSSQKIFTKDYENYKSDAIGVAYDGGITESEFNKKWNTEFNTEYAGIGTGFLISGQDWGKIKVKSCKLISTSEDEDFIFNVEIEDIEYKEIYKRDIYLIYESGKFLISDILEFNN